MLGNNVGSLTCQTTPRVMPAKNGMPCLEITAVGSGTLAGQQVQVMATFSATAQPDGSWYGECPEAGVVMSASGMATYRASAAGHTTAEGGFSMRGVVYFSSQDTAMSVLNGKACVFTWEVDAAGTAQWEIWEIN